MTSKSIPLLLVLVFTLALFACDSANTSYKKETGQIEWPAINQETKPWTRWWWFGNAVTKEGLTAALESYAEAGLGGVEITPVYGIYGAEAQFINFLSPQWMELFQHTLHEAKRLGLGVDLANASGWPFGGPWVDDTTACKYMASRIYRLKEGQQLSEKIEYEQNPIVRMEGKVKMRIEDIKEPVTANENLQECAFDQIRHKKQLPLVALTANKVKQGNGTFVQSIDLTDKVVDGNLVWIAPEGDWVICALFQGNHGKMVERAGSGGEGNVIDHFSEKALKKYLEPFDKAFSGYDISHLRYYFNDSYEVDDAIGEANWTPEFFTEFLQMQQYDLKKYIPALLGLDTEEQNTRVLYDYRATISTLLLERYTKNWHAWAVRQGKGIRNQSHGSPANVLDLYAVSDIPEIEGNDIVNLKSASSIAHVTGKRLTSSESATWLNEHFESSLGDVKACLNKLFLSGVNHAFYHGTAYSPQDAAWPGWLFYAAVHFTPANTLWSDFATFNNYVARSQSFLQAGNPSNEILLYCGVADIWSERGKGMLYHFHSDRLFDDLTLKECGNYMTEGGYSWDALSDKMLLDVSCKNTHLETGGNKYKTILVPETRYMPLETFEKLMALTKAGATVLFHKTLPEDVPGLSNLADNRKSFHRLKEKLSFTEGNAVSTAQYGKGRIVVSDSLPVLINSGDVYPESLYNTGLQCIRRLKDDGNYYYFVFNPSEERAFDGWITLNAEYTSAALYHLLTEKTGYARVRVNNDNTELYLQLKPQETLVIETFRGKHAGAKYPYYASTGGKAIALSDWKISFVEGGPILPASVITNDLKSWTEYGATYSAFSGIAHYETTIPPLSGEIDNWLLDLDNVHETAVVYLNDVCLGTLFNKPYTLEIPAALLKGNDKLKIKVTNLMANRIIDMDKRGIEWRIFYNTNFSTKYKENRGDDGKFTAKSWEPKCSGIVGCVTLHPLITTIGDGDVLLVGNN